MERVCVYTMLSTEAKEILLFIYASNDVNIGAEISTQAIKKILFS